MNRSVDSTERHKFQEVLEHFRRMLATSEERALTWISTIEDGPYTAPMARRLSAFISETREHMALLYAEQLETEDKFEAALDAAIQKSSLIMSAFPALERDVHMFLPLPKDTTPQLPSSTSIWDVPTAPVSGDETSASDRAALKRECIGAVTDSCRAPLQRRGGKEPSEPKRGSPDTATHSDTPPMQQRSVKATSALQRGSTDAARLDEPPLQ